MLSAGVADVVLKFLQSEMPPVQFKLTYVCIKQTFLLMGASIGLNFCKLLRSSLNICLEFAPPQTNQEFYLKALFLLSNILAADRRIYHKNYPPPPIVYLSKRL